MDPNSCLPDLLPRADFALVTVLSAAATVGMFGARELRLRG